MMKRSICLGIVGGIALSACAVDYTWLANPLSANWLTDANWDQGAWDETATANKAVFGASAQTAVDVNGDVTASSVAVSGADYAFGGTGTLTVNGSFNVAAGNTVTVNGPLAQKGAVANRFVKDGDGTLVLKGTNTYEGATKVSGGKLIVGDGYVFPQNQPLVMAGGKFSLGNASLSVSDLSGYGEIESGNNHLTISGKLSFSVDDALAGRCLMITNTIPAFGAGSSVEISGTLPENVDVKHVLAQSARPFEGTPEIRNDNRLWLLSFSGDRKVLTLKRVRGSTVIMR